MSTVEHISRFLAQCGEAAAEVFSAIDCFRCYVWINLHIFFVTATKLHQQLRRSGEVVPQVVFIRIHEMNDKSVLEYI